MNEESDELPAEKEAASAVPDVEHLALERAAYRGKFAEQQKRHEEEKVEALIQTDLARRHRLGLYRERTRWIWLSLCSMPLAAAAAAPVGPLLALAWIGFCTVKIDGVNTELSRRHANPLQDAGIFFGLLFMNLLIAFGIFCAACVIMAGGMR